MKKIKITTKTPEQIMAEFETAFRDVRPIPTARPLTQADRLAPYRAAIVRQRRRRLTWRQIAEVMSGPVINEKVSEQLLREVFDPKAKAPAAVYHPAPDRMALDPLTGQTVVPGGAA